MYTDRTPPITTPEEILDGVAGVREQQRLLDRAMVVFAVEWAKHHPEEPASPEDVIDCSSEEQWSFDEIAAKGCLTFDDYEVPDFAISAGLTEYSARKLIRESLMLVHLLPRVWGRVLSGKVDVWRARALAGDCFDLNLEAIRFIDEHMSGRTVRITLGSRERIVAEARQRFMPEEEKAAAEQAREGQDVQVFSYLQDRGTVQVYGRLDAPDAQALEAALAAGAKALKEAGSDAPLGLRRSWALGDLARFALGGQSLFTSLHSVDLNSTDSTERPHWNGQSEVQANIKLFVHLPSSTFFNPGSTREPNSTPNSNPNADVAFAVVEGDGFSEQAAISIDTVREWFSRPTLAGAHLPRLSVRPVINVDEDSHTSSYSPTERMREQVLLTTNVCVFPFCTRAAHRCDIDHNEPWEPDREGGATCSCNLAPLCRSHHRLKTHSDNMPTGEGLHSRWSYVHLGGQEYFWKGPRGMEFISTPQGTYNAHPSRNDGAPPHPGSVATPLPAVDTGEPGVPERTFTLIDELLAQAAMTRGVKGRDYSPRWVIRNGPPELEPPEDYPEDDEFPSMYFFTPYIPAEGTPEWDLLMQGSAA